MVPEQAVAARILELARLRGPAKSLCPSEVARSLAPLAWRPLMPDVRRVAQSLARQNLLLILQAGRPLSNPLAPLRGPIRLAIPHQGVDPPPS